MEYLLIDGYNVLNAWNDVFDVTRTPLEDCREKLLQMVSNFQGYKNINVIVVFDAHLVKGSQQKTEAYDNITVVFTKENETADNYIERFVYKLGATHKIRVVTSDYLEQTIVMSKGGVRVTPKEFRAEVQAATKSESTNLKNQQSKANTIMSRIDPELLDKLEKIRRSKF